MTGHSIAEIVLSPREIDYTALTRPDALILLSRDGLSTVGHQLAAMEPEDHVFASPEFADVETRDTKHVIDPAKAPTRPAKGAVALFCLARALNDLGIVSIEAMEAAALLRPSEHAEKNAEAIRSAGAG